MFDLIEDILDFLCDNGVSVVIIGMLISIGISFFVHDDKKENVQKNSPPNKEITVQKPIDNNLIQCDPEKNAQFIIIGDKKLYIGVLDTWGDIKPTACK